MAAVVAVRGKGLGVVASRDLAPHTRVARYPGALRTPEEFEDRVGRGLTAGRYAMGFYALGPRGSLEDRVLDPGAAGGRLAARYAASLAPRVNEPDPGTRPNLVWVWNLPRAALELWTGARGADRGEELTACYGRGRGYARNYATPCTRSGPGLYVVLARGQRPRSLRAVGGLVGVQRHLASAAV